MSPLPPPECELGYTEGQIEQIVGDRLGEFDRWMNGQTMGLCDGRRYDHEKREHLATGCGPHGAVVYGHDLRRFLAGLPVVD